MTWPHVSQMSGGGEDHSKLRNTQLVSRAATPREQEEQARPDFSRQANNLDVLCEISPYLNPGN